MKINNSQIITSILTSLVLMGCVAKDTGTNEDAINNYVDSNKRVQCLGKQCTGSGDQKSIKAHKPKSDYEAERDKTLAKIIKTPPMPLRVPDTVIRVLVLPYVDDEQTLTAQAYKFVKVDNGKWMLGEYLRNEGGAINALTPLENAVVLSQQADITPPSAPAETEKASLSDNLQQLQQKTSEEIK